MAFLFIFFMAFLIILSHTGVNLFNVPPVRRFVTNVKQRFGIAETIFDLEIPAQVCRADHFIPGKIIVQSTDEEEVYNITISLVEKVTSHHKSDNLPHEGIESKRKPGNRSNSTTKTTLSEIVLTDNFKTKPSEPKELNFELPFNVGNTQKFYTNKYLNRDEFVFVRVMKILSTFTHKHTTQYYINVCMNVRDKWTTPKKSKIITLI